MFLVGKIVATHGIKGELKIKSETNFNRFFVGNILHLKTPDGYLSFTIKSHRPHKGVDLLTFEGFDNINQVIPYVGLSLYTEHEDDLDENEYYFESLIGLKVYSQTKEFLGLVEDVLEVPQGFILKVKTNDNMFMVPFVDAFIKEVNDEHIIIEVIEGLL